MNLNEKIKYLCPNINDSEFIIQDDSNGKGAYIKTWLSTQYVKPIQSDFDSIPIDVILDNKKKKKILELKRTGLEVGYSKAPIWKQANVGMVIYNSEIALPIIKWIKSTIQAVDEIEIKINEITEEKNLNNIIITFDIIKQRAEEIFITL